MRFRIPWLALILALSACGDSPAIDWYDPDIPAEHDTRLFDGSDRDVPTDCVSEHHKACCGDNVCWFDSCGNAGRVVTTCEEGCSNDLCRNCVPNCQGRDCGDDGCGGDCGFCDPGYCQGAVWMLPATCIAGACKGGGAAVSCDDTNACTDDACLSPVGCVHTPRTGNCDDGDPCTVGDTCSGGACVPGAPLDCNDSEPCTIDSCLAGYGCRNVNVSNGTVCQQGACNGLTLTTPMTCTMGACGGGGDTLSCSDELQCTVDACDPNAGCSNTLATGWCLIDGGCYQANQFMDGNACRKCSPAANPTAWTLLDDGDPCGGGEFCFAGYCGCVPECTGRECGDDGCGGSCGSCAPGQCNGLSWTPPQLCDAGDCTSVGTSSCNDGLTCTNDSCVPSSGCQHTLVAGTCLISGTCYLNGQWDTNNPCRVCAATTSQQEWTMLQEGAPCGNEGKTCQDGYCGCRIDCLGRECGDDGCGGSCGDCDFGMDCNLGGNCVTAPLCEAYPSTWAPIGAVSYLQTPANKTIAGTVCFDYTGEGTGDSGLAGLAGQLNPAFVDIIEGGGFSPLFEFPNVGSFTSSGVFQLRGLLGQSTANPPVVGGEHRLDPISYASDCEPVNRFNDARISGGQLSATTDVMWTHWSLTGDIEEFYALARFRDARLRASVVEGGPDGVVVKSGVLSAVLLKEDITEMLDGMQAACDRAPEGEEPSYCGYVGMARQLLPTLYDLHRTDAGEYFVKGGDHAANAISVCWQFETAKGSIVGMMPR